MLYMLSNMFLREAFYAHQGYIYLIWFLTAKTVILWIIIIIINYKCNLFLWWQSLIFSSPVSHSEIILIFWFAAQEIITNAENTKLLFIETVMFLGFFWLI